MPRPSIIKPPAEAAARETTEGAPIQVIARACAVLRSLVGARDGISLGQIAQRTDLPRSTVQRLIAALEAEAFVASASATGGWRLGPGLARLAGNATLNPAAFIRPFILELSGALEETVDLSVPEDDHVIFIDQVAGTQRLRAVSAVGERFPLTCTANGKAFLASLSDEALRRIVGKRYPARTPNSIVSFDNLAAEIEIIRKTGVALDREEHMLGVAAAGIMVVDMHGNPLLISVPVPAARFAEREALIIEKLTALRARLQAHLAGD
ncbi:MAG: IclR family transcriptional regulator [Acidocella sp.]|nr:IclR family transcriptional regulator [Acidocella sp.]